MNFRSRFESSRTPARPLIFTTVVIVVLASIACDSTLGRVQRQPPAHASGGPIIVNGVNQQALHECMAAQLDCTKEVPGLASCIERLEVCNWDAYNASRPVKLDRSVTDGEVISAAMRNVSDPHAARKVFHLSVAEYAQRIGVDPVEFFPNQPDDPLTVVEVDAPRTLTGAPGEKDLTVTTSTLAVNPETGVEVDSCGGCSVREWRQP